MKSIKFGFGVISESSIGLEKNWKIFEGVKSVFKSNIISQSGYTGKYLDSLFSAIGRW